jgi:hypothetical protein
LRVGTHQYTISSQVSFALVPLAGTLVTYIRDLGGKDQVSDSLQLLLPEVLF